MVTSACVEQMCLEGKGKGGASSVKVAKKALCAILVYIKAEKHDFSWEVTLCS